MRRLIIGMVVLLVGAVVLGCVPEQGLESDQSGEGPIIHYSPSDSEPRWISEDTILFVSGRVSAPGTSGAAVYVVGTDGTSLRRLSPRCCCRADVSPDGRYVLLDPGGGEPTRLLDLRTGHIADYRLPRAPYCKCFGATSDDIFYVTPSDDPSENSTIWAGKLGSDGLVRGERKLASVPPPAQLLRSSPDGKRLSCFAFSASLEFSLMVGPAATADMKQVLKLKNPGARLPALVWLADSRRILYQDDGAHIANVTTGETFDYEAYLRQQGKLAPGLLDSMAHFAPDPRNAQRMACTVSRKKGKDKEGNKLVGVYVAVMDFDGGNFRQLTFETPEAGIPYAYDRQFDVPVDSGLK